jgi:hypothetical protein
MELDSAPDMDDRTILELERLVPRVLSLAKPFSRVCSQGNVHTTCFIVDVFVSLNRHLVEDKLLRPVLDPNWTQNWTQTGPKIDQNWIKIGSKLVLTWS